MFNEDVASGCSYRELVSSGSGWRLPCGFHFAELQVKGVRPYVGAVEGKSLWNTT